MIRLTVSAAVIVWSVERTRWPVSASVSTVCMVSTSRISPTMTTFGSWRRQIRSASAKAGASIPTSRWVMMLVPSSNRYSIGSSIVTMWSARWWFMWLIIDASVVVLPQPAGPVTRIRPRGSMASFATTGGRCSSSKVGGS